MKHKITIITFLIICTYISGFAEGENISVYIDGNPIAFTSSPYTENYRTMVPMRKIFEELGAAVEWDGNTQSITAKDNNITVILAIGMNTMYINSTPIILDAVPALVNDTTYIPLRAVSEAFNCTVTWSETDNSVYIKTSKNIIKSYDGYTNIPDFGSAFNITPLSVLENGSIYSYDRNIIPENAEAEYKTIMLANGFEEFAGNGYTIYTREYLSVMAGYSGNLFRVVIIPY